MASSILFTAESQSGQTYTLAIGHVATAATTRGHDVPATDAPAAIGHVGTVATVRGHDIATVILIETGDIASVAATRGLVLTANLTATELGHIASAKQAFGVEAPYDEWSLAADFESGTLADFFDDSVGSTASLATDRSHSGTTAYKVTQSGTASASKVTLAPSPQGTIVGRFWFNLDSTPGSTLQLLNIQFGADSFVIRVLSNGTLQAGFGASYQNAGVPALDTHDVRCGTGGWRRVYTQPGLLREARPTTVSTLARRVRAVFWSRLASSRSARPATSPGRRCRTS